MLRYTLLLLIMAFTFFHVFPAQANTTTFQEEEKKIISCGEILSKPYNVSWDDFRMSAKTAEEKVLIEIINIIEKKDKEGLKKLSYPTDEAEFNRQAGAYFLQLEKIKPVRVTAFYEFQKKAIFYMMFEVNGKTTPVNFPFFVGEERKLNTPPLFIIDKMPLNDETIYSRLGKWHVWDKNETLYPCEKISSQPQ